MCASLIKDANGPPHSLLALETTGNANFWYLTDTFVVFRLPNGQSIPVEIPATPVVTSSLNTRTTAASVVTCIAPVAPAYQTTAFTSVITNPTPSLAKLVGLSDTEVGANTV